MKRIILAAALMLACGDGAISDETPTMGVSREGIPIVCKPPRADELRFSGYAGYDPAGCTKSERMADVKPWADEEDEVIVEIGKAEQPITVQSGTEAATQITVNSSGTQITGFKGRCPTDPTWTTARPRIGDCIIPEVVSGLNWSVCPSCYSSTHLTYMKNRMKEAWDVWKFSTSSTCGSSTFTNSLASTASSENTASSNAETNFDNARIPVYPMFGNFVSARMEVDKDFIFARTPIRQGIRYWSWQNAGIAIDHDIVESVKLPQCVSENDPQLDLKLMRAYRWILAHELGHAFGMPHRSAGIMRSASGVACSDLFSAATQAPALTAPDTIERLIVNSMKNSSGFDVIFATGTTGCGTASGAITSTPDDESVVNF